jgi:hypothetical protein
MDDDDARVHRRRRGVAQTETRFDGLTSGGSSERMKAARVEQR